jgi:beta-N-acetylhexosaminidase
MVGHIRQPAWSRRLRPGIEDADLMPASLAPELVEGLLRGHLGFNGLVVSDASVMAGMAVMPRRELVPSTIAAGCDMILFAGDLDEDLEAMRWGIESGLIGDARLHAALTRILALKASLGMHRADERASGAAPDADSALAVFRTPEHAAWAREVAARSVTLVKSTKPILPLDPETHHRVLLHDLHGGAGFFDSTDRGADRMLEARLVSEGFEVSRWVSRGGPGGDTAPTRDTVDRYDLIIYLARLATRSNQTTVRVEWAQPMGANTPTFVTTVPTIAISVENPYHLLDMPSVPVFINTYNASPTTIEALVDCLLGRAPFLGASPVDPFCGRWDARV